MKRRCLSICFCILGVVLIITGQMVRENRERELYGDVLKRCEWVWENWKIYREQEFSEWFTQYDSFFGYAANAEKYGYNIVYCVQDLNNDGIPELIVGIQKTENQAVNIRIVYHYEDGDLKVDWEDRYVMEIYKGGIIEHCIGTGPTSLYLYSCYMPHSGETEHLDGVEFVAEEPPKFYRMIYGKDELKMEITEEEYNRQKKIYAETGKYSEVKKLEVTNEEPPKFYGFIEVRELKKKEEITEEEYNRQKELYTGLGKEEFQWRELQGFLEGGETFESLFVDHYHLVE